MVMTGQRLAERLVSEVPELRSLVQRHVSGWGDAEDPYLLMDDVQAFALGLYRDGLQDALEPLLRVLADALVDGDFDVQMAVKNEFIGHLPPWTAEMQPFVASGRPSCVTRHEGSRSAPNPNDSRPAGLHHQRRAPSSRRAQHFLSRVIPPLWARFEGAAYRPQRRTDLAPLRMEEATRQAGRAPSPSTRQTGRAPARRADKKIRTRSAVTSRGSDSGVFGVRGSARSNVCGMGSADEDAGGTVDSEALRGLLASWNGSRRSAFDWSVGSTSHARQDDGMASLRRYEGRAMRAWAVSPDGGGRLVQVHRDAPVPRPDELVVEVSACGVCRTDLHLALHELPPRHPFVVPGHEAVGEVVRVGEAVTALAVGDRVGVAWLRSTCGQCRWCRTGAENLCPHSTYTGWDTDGGFAELASVPAAYAYRLPERFDDRTAAPLLCAGIIGYRALRRAALPPGGRLGVYGFGGSAHITAQIAIAQGAEVHVLTRDVSARRLALQLGAASVADAYNQPPVLLDSAILFAPVGDLVPTALRALDRGGTLAVAGIHLTDVPPMDYQQELFGERTLTTVTANTRADGEELLRLAAALDVTPVVAPYPFEAADQALQDLHAGRVVGAAVLVR